MDQPLLFLIKLAWACRYRLPILITIGFMALDIRMQLEIHIQMRRIRRAPPLPRTDRHTHENVILNSDDLDSNSNSSWSTVDDDDENEDETEISTTQYNTARSRSATTSSLNSVDTRTHSQIINVDLEN